MRATMDGPATGQHDVKTGKKTGPPPRGDAILPHWGGREFFAAATAWPPRRKVAIRAIPADGTRLAAVGTGSRRRGSFSRLDEVARRACFRYQHNAARRRKETPTRCWHASIERNSRQVAATVGGRRRYLAPKQVF